MRDFRFRLAGLRDRFAANFRAFYRAFRLREGFRCSEFTFVSLVRIGIRGFIYCEIRLSVFRSDVCGLTVGIRICGMSIQYMCRIARTFDEGYGIDDGLVTIFVFLDSMRCTEGAVIFAGFADNFLADFDSREAFSFG